MQSLKQAVESAQTALQATEAGYEVGTRTSVDVLQARQRLFQSQTDYRAQPLRLPAERAAPAAGGRHARPQGPRRHQRPAVGERLGPLTAPSRVGHLAVAASPRAAARASRSTTAAQASPAGTASARMRSAPAPHRARAAPRTARGRKAAGSAGMRRHATRSDSVERRAARQHGDAPAARRAPPRRRARVRGLDDLERRAGRVVRALAPRRARRVRARILHAADDVRDLRARDRAGPQERHAPAEAGDDRRLEARPRSRRRPARARRAGRAPRARRPRASG